MKRRVVASTIQAAGLLTIAAGIGLVSLWGGIVAAGLGAVIYGVALERSDH